MRSLRVGCPAVLVLAALAAPAGLPGAAHADAPTCEGQEATLVGGPDEVLTGTAGADVVVTAGARAVLAGDGDDVVCVTGPAPRDPAFGVLVRLGAGDDVARGGDGVDRVFTGTGDDDVTTAGGWDVVVVDPGEHPGDGFGGVLDLGTDGGSLSFNRPGVAPDVVLHGGGRSSLALSGDDQRVYPGTWVVDTQDGTATLDGERRLRFDGFSGFDWGGNAVELRGSAADEHVSSAHLLGADMGAGDDRVEAAWGPEVHLDPPVLDGGPGQDAVVTGVGDYFYVEARIDLAAGTMTLHDDQSPTYALAGFEDAVSYLGGRFVFRGTGQRNVVRFESIRSTVDTGDGNDLVVGGLAQDPEDGGRYDAHARIGTGGGDDVVRMSGKVVARVVTGAGDDLVTYVRPRTSLDWEAVRLFADGGAGADRLVASGREDVLRGGAGPDVLVGGRRDDRLLGQGGRDVARGGPGRDRCVSERRHACER